MSRSTGQIFDVDKGWHGLCSALILNDPPPKFRTTKFVSAIKKLEKSLKRKCNKYLFQHLEPLRDSRVWRTDVQTDVTIANAALNYIRCAAKNYILHIRLANFLRAYRAIFLFTFIFYDIVLHIRGILDSILLDSSAPYLF